MIIRLRFLFFIFLLGWSGCKTSPPAGAGAISNRALPFSWKNATVYFLLTDRFNNGNTANDEAFNRHADGAFLRTFLGGDIAGITQKVEEGYFDALGVNVLWMTPVVEQIHGFVDEGTGKTYGFHGYWTRDWTTLDPNFGTVAELRQLVAAAHQRGIRVLMDVVINHTGPVTQLDPQWPEDWVRTSPQCTYQDYETTVKCTLVRNLPDIRTEKEEAVDLPPALLAKWEAEGRKQQELRELDAFFERTGYPRAPKYYIIKWLTDWVRELGIDGYRVDTVKHTEEEVWAALKAQALIAFEDWKRMHPSEVLDDEAFFMLGEVYGYGLGGGRNFSFGDRQVDYFDYGFESLINFAFKSDATRSPDALFQQYSAALNGGPLTGLTVLNYISSHDDGSPFDPDRRQPLDAGTRLLLAPGGAQIYYGDETARPLRIEGAKGDANLRSFMNWEDLQANSLVSGIPTQTVLDHWRKLGRFRREHLAVGAGRHERLQDRPYIFSRTYKNDGQEDRVVVGLEMPAGEKMVTVAGVFADGTILKDYYSGSFVKVKAGAARVDSPFTIVLLGEEFKMPASR